MTIFAGLGGSTGNACVSLVADGRMLAVAEQERITRVRSAGFNASGLPDEVLDTLLQRSGLTRRDIHAYGLAEPAAMPDGLPVERVGRHYAHACAAFLPSPFDAATILICDHEPPEITLWDGEGRVISPLDEHWNGPGFASVYSQCAEALGFGSRGGEQRLEALARLLPAAGDTRAATLLDSDHDRLRLTPDWQARLQEWSARSSDERAVLAAAVQARIAELLVDFLARVRARRPDRRNLCVAGSLFYNSHVNAALKRAGLFEDVFVPINPGIAGLAVGTAMHLGGSIRQPVPPFLGPSYRAEEIKATLDNCKLTYQWASEADTIACAVDELRHGRLVAWFDGPMEWGPRALGGRSIFANPFAPYALENLNRFLKQREPWRGYALSGLDAAVHEHFEGDYASPFMECDYVPRDPERFRHILPGSTASVRVQTVGAGAPARFRGLLEAFGEAAGAPILVNTSFNGFREPIVCSPRDAIRVFFGTGIDTLIMGQFVVRK